jgi:predicted membrane chloride channel (bestrophin family)
MSSLSYCHFSSTMGTNRSYLIILNNNMRFAFSFIIFNTIYYFCILLIINKCYGLQKKTNLP